MPVLVAPIAGALSDRIGGRPLLVAGLALQAIGLGWLAAVASPTVPYAHAGAGLRGRRRRHGAVLRARRQRRARLGAPRPGGHGLGREQRDPRARRGLRHRRARRGVLRPRQLRQRLSLRRRAWPRPSGSVPRPWPSRLVPRCSCRGPAAPRPALPRPASPAEPGSRGTRAGGLTSRTPPSTGPDLARAAGAGPEAFAAYRITRTPAHPGRAGLLRWCRAGRAMVGRGVGGRGAGCAGQRVDGGG